MAKGSCPKVKSPPGKVSICYSGFVSPEDGTLFVTKPTWFTYETVIESFRQFVAACPLSEGKKICLVLDNAPWRKKACRLIKDETVAEYADLREKLEWVMLPPYSPDLNPIEQVWRVTRREMTHNRYCPSRAALEERLDGYFSDYSRPNQKFQRLCDFKHKI